MGELVVTGTGNQSSIDLAATVANLGATGQLDLHLDYVQAFGYGDNPHQIGHLFDLAAIGSPLALRHFEQQEGKLPSKSNFFDITRARRLVTRTAANFDVNEGQVPILSVLMKHGNAAGGAFDFDDPGVAARKAVDGSPEDSFGATFVTTAPIDDEVADALDRYQIGDAPRRVMDVVVAPAITDEALTILGRKANNLKVLINPALAALSRMSILRGIEMHGDGDVVSIQTPNLFTVDPTNPSQQLQLMAEVYDPNRPISRNTLFAEGVGSSTTSNTVTLVNDSKIVGNGAGQQARHRAAELAVHRARIAGNNIVGGSLYSDSFFLKRDGVDFVAREGVIEGFGTRRDGKTDEPEVFGAFAEHGVQYITAPNSIARGFIH